ncbi:hypothetical protein LOY64_01485 [Pseudomonas corrugata]|uniref:hypothetical protein n=1 Tax=Pseudomonas corrugata TaxID=47879 RepID=UPI00222EAB0F|nr:hypothetical protein [Pseudomonas corrugata]UZD95714.1 hypothetical protein LOY64_01485 [Pseudomonas corrugata]
MKNIIISIKPKFCKEIYSGAKTLELRKSIGIEFVPNARLYIYESAPTKSLTGEAVIDRVSRLSVGDIKKTYLSAACIDAEEFDNYYFGKSFGYVIFLRDVKHYSNKLLLKEMMRIGFHAPQSFAYARPEMVEFIELNKCI